jgi:energy-coupling factor transporter transmembrane protein EcfT
MKGRTELTFLRLVPGNSVMHHLWAGTKLLVAAALALVLSISPTWEMIAIAAAIIIGGLLVARIPIGAFPRLPSWFYLLLLVGAALNLLSGVDPTFEVAGVSLSLGGLEQWARFTTLAIVLIASGALIGWTTPLGDVAPAVRTLLAPLRVLRLPVDEWVVALALAIRCLPMLIDEIRTLAAAIRLRVHDPDGNEPEEKLTIRHVLIETHDLLATGMIATIRRGRDVAEAIVARGGLGGAVAASRRGPRAADWVVLVAVTALCAAGLTVLQI